jgi:hypothetical protein
MSGSFFGGFSGVFRPYTILYTRARDGAASRPTGFLFHWSRCLVVTNRIFTATNGISVVTNGISVARRMAFKLQIRRHSGFVYIIPWYKIFALYHGTTPSHGTQFFCCTTGEIQPICTQTNYKSENLVSKNRPKCFIFHVTFTLSA